MAVPLSDVISAIRSATKPSWKYAPYGKYYLLDKTDRIEAMTPAFLAEWWRAPIEVKSEAKDVVRCRALVRALLTAPC